jgi:hypothetical protein
MELQLWQRRVTLTRGFPLECPRSCRLHAMFKLLVELASNYWPRSTRGSSKCTEAPPSARFSAHILPP